ncbi:MAG: hypothetical protein F6J90_12680 [Moorea sp. SIOASIH]|uniref:hypothetical protein n=1 Tax=Moorena sp. SIOASIH TaxID=2607817 RepID=UPI0013BC611E|nr:hypothetical protein [Moorena sp. SIOASIH]NEO37122.1 hypothetical protein [Moorena sp. SIOASIH]
MPTNALCKLHYLSGALPTLHEPSLLRMVQDVSKSCKLIYIQIGYYLFPVPCSLFPLRNLGIPI